MKLLTPLLFCVSACAECEPPIDTCPWQDTNTSQQEHNNSLMVRSHHHTIDDPFCGTYPLTHSPRHDRMPMFLIRHLARASGMSVPNWLHHTRVIPIVHEQKLRDQQLARIIDETTQTEELTNK